MPANLTPQFKSAELRYKEAKTPEEKLAALEEMYRTIPKHKGTEKMRSDIKQRLSKTRQQIQQAAQSGKKGLSYHVSRDGAAQIVLVGPPNSGKSSIIGAYTNAEPEIADYAYTTRVPQPAMLKWNNVNFQLVDLPPVGQEFFEPWVPSLIRVSDLVFLVIRLDNPDGLEYVIETLKEYKIELIPSIDSAAYHDRVVKLPAVIIGTANDHADAEIGLELLREEWGTFSIIPVTTTTGTDADSIGAGIMSTLDLIRVYTKAPGKDPVMSKPVVVRRGATLLDVATMVHKDFAQELKYARVWGSGKFDGQRIQRDYLVEEGDILEFKI